MPMTSFTWFESLGVVPILTNAGAALAAPVIAWLGSGVAMLFKPRELAGAVRRRPWVPAAALILIVGGYFLFAWLLAAPPGNRNVHAAAAPPVAGASAAQQTDWAKVAIEILRNERDGVYDTRPPVAAGNGGGPTTAAANGNSGATTAPARTTATIFRYDAARCGHDGGPSPLDLKPRWEAYTADEVILSSPIVHEGRVYAASACVEGVINYGALFCLDAATGRPVWRMDNVNGELPQPFFSSPAVSADGKYVVIGQGLHPNKDSELLCVHADTGTLAWRLKTPLHIESSPAIHGDIVIAGAGAIEDPKSHKPLGDPGYVFAVQLSTGKQLWRYTLPDPESSPAISADGIVYIGSGFNGNAVVALRVDGPDDQRLVWKQESPYPVTGPVTLAGDLVLAGAGNSDFVFASDKPEGIVLALDRKTGAVKWKANPGDAVLGAIAVRDGRAICPVRSGEVVALDLADGKILWRQAVSGKSPIVASPAVTATHVYAVSKDGYMAVLDVADGKVIQRLAINDETKPTKNSYGMSSPLVAGGRVFVGTENAGLRCFVGGRVAP